MTLSKAVALDGSLTDQALALAATGVPVFPLLASKNPAKAKADGGRGYLDATTDPAAIRVLFARPGATLIGVPTGGASGFDALDLDPRHGSDVWPGRLRLPITRTHGTGGGGEHFLFRHAPGLRCSAGRIAPGVDVRADGGYIVWWPCTMDEPLDDWPQWLLEAALTPARAVGDIGHIEAPPSAAAVINLLDRLPNPAENGRDVWTSVMLAAVGCVQVLEGNGEDADGIAEAACRWADKWPGSQGYDAELAKWESDWQYRDRPLAGWRNLCARAGRAVVGYAVERAAAEFAGVPLPPAVEHGPAPILDPNAPLATARRFIELRHTHEQVRTLHHQNSSFFTWERSHYEECSPEELRSKLYAFLEKARRLAAKGEVVAFDPTKAKVSNVIEATAAAAQLPLSVRPPSWLDGRTGIDPADILACENGLVYLPSRALLPHTPAFFTLNAIDYAYDAEAPTPEEWLRFLDTVWADDKEAIDTLQEMFGLLLTPDTRHQKAFLIVGPKRSGKGTIARLLTRMLGAPNVCGPTLGNLAQNFGIEPLIGKRLAVISDARLGGKADHQVIAERVLAITGEDSLTVDRKNRTAWTGQIGARFVILTNELPQLRDASGALASRFITLVMKRSFYGNEDMGLESRLMDELPGILRWSLVGLDRLKDRGYFIQPSSSQQAQQDMADLGSPITAFLRERCVVGQSKRVSVDVLYQAWCIWCREEGRDHPGTKQTFGRDVSTAIPGITVIQARREDGNRDRFYAGVGLAVTPAGVTLHDMVR